jgi:branched-chain amino acid transport system ATP-binding protein
MIGPAPTMAGQESASPALQLCNVRAGYGRTEVLHGVSLTVPTACTVALIGPNGAGKTTLLRVAAGLLKPTAGQVVLDQRKVTALAPDVRARLGLCDIPEGRGIFPSLTVKENLLLQSPRGRHHECLSVAVDLFPSLSRRLHQPAGNLSGGEQQMLAVSRAYLTNPKIVVVDEVSLGLAPLVVDAIYDALAGLSARGTAVLLVDFTDRIS